LLAEIESLSERIAEYNERIEKLAQERYPQTASYALFLLFQRHHCAQSSNCMS